MSELVPVQPPLSEVEEFRGILEMARTEVARRLRSPKLRAEIPAGTLLKFTMDATKLIVTADQDAGRDAKAEAQTTHVLAVLGNDGLPLERQIELIEAMIAEVGPERAAELGLTGGLAMLAGRKRAAKATAIEQETDDEEES